MKRSCALSHPSRRTLKTSHGLLLFFLLILCFTWKVTKKLFSSSALALLDGVQRQCAEPKPGGHSALTGRETQACLRKNNPPFLMHLPLGFSLFLLLILHRCDSSSGIPSWISHCQQSDDYVFTPSFLIVTMTLLFPFLDSALPFPISTLLSQLLYSCFSRALAWLMACIYLLLILIPSFLCSRLR